MTRPRRARWPARLVLLLILLWIGSVLWFGAILPRQVSDQIRGTDAIVVLTGGGERIGTGLDLLGNGFAKKLFISGANQQTAAPTIRNLRARSDLFDCCVVVGFEATDTAGNAIETAVWMQGEGYLSLRVVTAAYHMPRSILEFERAMPEMEIIPHPVFLVALPLDQWWRSPRAMTLIAGESFKYWMAWVRAGIIGVPAERRPVKANTTPEK